MLDYSHDTLVTNFLTNAALTCIKRTSKDFIDIFIFNIFTGGTCACKSDSEMYLI